MNSISYTDLSETWLDHLQRLAYRFSHLGITSDLASLTLIEMWGLYHFLLRIAGE